MDDGASLSATGLGQERLGHPATIPSAACIIKAPARKAIAGPSVFLAGSIDMGKAVNWQDALSAALSDLSVTILNPRRDDWDASWVQDISNAKFREQVEWELDHLAACDVIAMYFDPNGPAPISLLELGLYAASGKLIVCCPEGYWRRGNVQIICARHSIPLVDTVQELSALAASAMSTGTAETLAAQGRSPAIAVRDSGGAQNNARSDQ